MSHAVSKEADRRVGPVADVSPGRPRKNRHPPRASLTGANSHYSLGRAVDAARIRDLMPDVRLINGQK
jgi:hypothetical protein